MVNLYMYGAIQRKIGKSVHLVTFLRGCELRLYAELRRGREVKCVFVVIQRMDGEAGDRLILQRHS